MGIFAAIGATISSIVGALTAALTTVVAAISAATSWLVSSVIIPITTATSSLVTHTITKTVGLILEISQAAYEGTKGLMRLTENLRKSIKEFLDAIHFSTIMAVNDIALLVSDSWRDINRKIWGEVSQVSKAMFGTAEFLHTILMSSKTIVLDVAATTGQTFDLCEITWVEQEAEILRKIQYRSQKYNQHPEKLLEDITETVYRPFLDLKGRVMQAILTNIDGLGESLSLISKEADSIKESVEAIGNGVPDKVKELISPYIDQVKNTFNNWQVTTFNPIKVELEQGIRDIGLSLGVTKDDVKTIRDRIKTPATFLKEIDILPEEERQQEEVILADIVSRPVQRSADEIIDEYNRDKPDVLSQFDDFIPEPEPSNFSPFALDLSSKGEVQDEPKRLTWVIEDV